MEGFASRVAMSDPGSHVFEPNRLAIMSMAMHHFAFLAAQEPDEWATLKRQDFSAESYQSLVLLCLSGLAEHLVRQTHELDGVRHTLRARASGDYFKQFELAARHQVEIHFGAGHGAATRQGPEIEAIRLSEEGLAVTEDDARFVLSRVQAGASPSPGRIEWLGWEENANGNSGIARTPEEAAATSAEGTADNGGVVIHVSAPADPGTITKGKRSTERGEGRAKLVGALTKHHKYADGGCLNLEPVGNNELARLAKVAKRTASAFFGKEFGGHLKYRSLCQDPSVLAAALKALNGEFRPRDFYDVRSPDELDAIGE